MAAINVASRALRGARAEALVRFVAETVMAAPVVEKGIPAGLQTPDLSPEGAAFVDRCRALIEDADGSSASTKDIQSFLMTILGALPRVISCPTPDAGSLAHDCQLGQLLC
jgi:hypothetical protein